MTANTFKKLAQGQLPSSAGVLYTVPALTQAIVKTIVLSNTSVSTQTVTVYTDGIGASNTIGSLSIPAGGTATWTTSGWSVKDSTGATISTSVVALTGDVTGVGSGTVATVLATVNTNVGSFGTASSVGAQTVNAKGLTTAASAIPILITESQVTSLVTDLAGKQATGSYLTALTGDITAAGPGSAAATLATVNASPGTTGDASHTSAMTTNAKGLVTANTSTAIVIAESQVTNLVTDLAAKQATGNYVTALSGDITASGPGSAAATLATVNANTGSWGDASHVPQFTVNTKGLVTAAANVSIAIAAGAVSGLNAMATTNLSGDVTSSGATTTLATVNSNVGAFGDASHVAAVTVNAKGLVTAAASTGIAIANTAVSGLGTLSTQSGTFSGASSGTNTGDQTITLTGAVTGSGTGSFATTAATAVANTIKANATSSTATPTDVAVAANQFLARSSTGDIAAKTVSDSGLTWLILGSIAAQTAALNAATAAVQGMMSAQDKIRMGAQFDFQADFAGVGDLITTNSTSACSTGAPGIITDSANPFTSYYIGKRITLTGAGASGAQYVGTISSLNSAGSVNVTPNISTTVSAKIASFGTDNATALAALATVVNTTNALFPGVRCHWGMSATNAYGYSSIATFNHTLVASGIGSWFNTDNGDYTRIGGTRQAWWGTTSDGGTDFAAMWTFQPGGGATQAVKSPVLRDMWFDGRNGDQQAALYGVRFAGCHNPQMDNVGFMDFRGAGYLMNATAASLTPTADRGVLRPRINNVNVRNLETFTNAITTPITTSSVITLTNTGQNITVSAATMPVDASSTSYAWVQTNEGPRCLVKYAGGGTTTLNVKCSVEDAIYTYATVSGGNVVSATPQNAACFVLSGDTTANTNCGEWLLGQNTHGSVWGPAAIDIRNADSCDLIDVYTNGGSPTDLGAINRVTKEGVTFAGSNHATAAIGLACRNITFRSGDPSSAQAAGVTTFALLASGTKLIAPAGPNYWDLMQLGNGARAPKIEAGSMFEWTANGGVTTGLRNIATAQGQAITAATLTVVTGSVMLLPPQAFQIGTVFRWLIQLQKTSTAGTAARVFHIRVGTTGTSSDAIVQTFTSGVGTAVLAQGELELLYNITAIGGSATGAGMSLLKHAGTVAGTGIVGLATVPFPQIAGVPTAFNSASSGFLYISVTVTTGASETLTLNRTTAEIVRVGNQSA